MPTQGGRGRSIRSWTASHDEMMPLCIVHTWVFDDEVSAPWGEVYALNLQRATVLRGVWLEELQHVVAGGILSRNHVLQFTQRTEESMQICVSRPHDGNISVNMCTKVYLDDTAIRTCLCPAGQTKIAAWLQSIPMGLVYLEAISDAAEACYCCIRITGNPCGEVLHCKEKRGQRQIRGRPREILVQIVRRASVGGNRQVWSEQEGCEGIGIGNRRGSTRAAVNSTRTRKTTWIPLKGR